MIPYLMDHHVVWGEKEAEWVVRVKSHGGIDELLAPRNIKSEAAVPGRQAVGIVVDADNHIDSRWASGPSLLPRDRCRLPRGLAIQTA